MANWSNEEFLVCIEACRRMAEMEEAGVSFSEKQVYEELAARLGRHPESVAFTMLTLLTLLNELNLPCIRDLVPLKHIGEARRAQLIRLIERKTLEKDTGRGTPEYTRTWEKALAAVTQLGGTATRKQVEEWILAREPGYNTKNLADLYMMAVNAPARTGYSQNEMPRRTDEGNRYDKLFKVGKGIFELYNPVQHGIWEIYPEASSGSRFGVSIRRISNPVEEALAVAENAAEQAAMFDPADVADSRKRVTTDIIRRRGQPAFRRALMDAYGEACAITGCNLPAVLEAAHVHPYKGDHTNIVSNGLLLRADIHTLFDLGLIAIESQTMVVRVSPELENTDYGKLDGSPLRHPQQNFHQVSPEALDWHWNQCGWCD